MMWGSVPQIDDRVVVDDDLGVVIVSRETIWCERASSRILSSGWVLLLSLCAGNLICLSTCIDSAHIVEYWYQVCSGSIQSILRTTNEPSSSSVKKMMIEE